MRISNAFRQMPAGFAIASLSNGAATKTVHVAQQVVRAHASMLQPVVFVDDLRQLPSSWGRWAAVGEKAGYFPLMPGWPDDPAT